MRETEDAGLAFVGGLDIGQVGDPAAFALLQKVGEGTAAVYSVQTLRRYAIGTRYHESAGDALAVMSAPPAKDWPLAVDQTGVGRPVVEDMKGRGVLIVPVTITAGHQAHKDDYGWKVPKKDLVGVAQRLLQTRRLLISPALKHAKTLTTELRNFRVKLTKAANETFGPWREGDHDDLVFAVALAAWVGEKGCCGPWVYRPDPAARLEVARAPRGMWATDGPDDDQWPDDLETLDDDARGGLPYPPSW
jgi:hypothetical protein